MSEKIFLEIKGMHCPDCPAKVERTLSKLEGIDQVTVDYESENGLVTYDKNLISIDDITKRISGLGFEAKDIQRNVD